MRNILWILCWLSNAFLLQNSIQSTIFKEKIIDRKWGSKRGKFPLLGGRWMFRREMGSKRGTFTPKEGDLTCMISTINSYFLWVGQLMLILFELIKWFWKGGVHKGKKCQKKFVENLNFFFLIDEGRICVGQNEAGCREVASKGHRKKRPGNSSVCEIWFCRVSICDLYSTTSFICVFLLM